MKRWGLLVALVACRAKPTSVYEPAPPTARDAGVVATAPDAAPVPIEEGEPAVRGAIDAADMRAVMRAAAPDIGACYRAHRTEEPVPVELHFTIRPDGTVDSAAAEGAPAALAICITGVLLDLKFPAPRDGATVQVRYPLTLG